MSEKIITRLQKAQDSAILREHAKSDPLRVDQRRDTMSEKTLENKLRELKFVEDYANSQALDLVDSYVDIFERAAKEIRGYRERMVEAIAESKIKMNERSRTTPVDVLSWTLNAVRNPFMNLRIELACRVSAELTTAANMRRELERGETR